MHRMVLGLYHSIRECVQITCRDAKHCFSVSERALTHLLAERSWLGKLLNFSGLLLPVGKAEIMIMTSIIGRHEPVLVKLLKH